MHIIQSNLSEIILDYNSAIHKYEVANAANKNNNIFRIFLEISICFTHFN